MQRIGSLAGLKVIALLLLFWWHSPIPNPNVDIGARVCEFFFVVSGFWFHIIIQIKWCLRLGMNLVYM